MLSRLLRRGQLHGGVRANFFMGELPIRTGMTTSARPVPRSHTGGGLYNCHGAQAQGYATGQFGKTISAI